MVNLPMLCAYLCGMGYLFFKALHIIGFVSWFAGIFYLVRLFVYHREAWEKGDEASLILRKQYQLMEGRLYSIIQTPAMVLTLIGGTGMLILNPAWLQMPWMHIKLFLVVALVFYHFTCGSIMKTLDTAPSNWTSFRFRLFNELPTLILIAIVMLAVWKNLQGLWLGLVVLVALGILFFMAAKLYRKKREQQGNNS